MNVVNVASVPQRSPFRYPGGKTWLVPIIRRWLRSINYEVQDFVEPFAGGGIASLTAVFEELASRATMVELDPDVGSVWRTILNGQGAWLAREISGFDLTKENVMQRLDSVPNGSALRERAFQTILRNRVNRGGILAPGAGITKLGENGKGIASRWYPETLRKRILAIVQLKHRFNFMQVDGIGVLKEFAEHKNAAFFIDPPYTVAGRRLYTHSQIDHRELFAIAEKLHGNFLMTYDDATEIRSLASEYSFQVVAVPMKNTHHATKFELLIGRDLSWLDSND